jgi:hypothetical protein
MRELVEVAQTLESVLNEEQPHTWRQDGAENIKRKEPILGLSRPFFLKRCSGKTQTQSYRKRDSLSIGGSLSRYAQLCRAAYGTGGSRLGSTQGGGSSNIMDGKVFSFSRCGVCSHFHLRDCRVTSGKSFIYQ